MRKEVTRYLLSDQGLTEVAIAVDQLLKPDDYYEKALGQLKKAARLLQYARYINQDASDSHNYEVAVHLKFLTDNFLTVTPKEEDVEKLKNQVREDLEEVAQHYRPDKDYPQIKHQVARTNE